MDKMGNVPQSLKRRGKFLSSGLSFGGMKQGMIPVYNETFIFTNDDEGFE